MMRYLKKPSIPRLEQQQSSIVYTLCKHSEDQTKEKDVCNIYLSIYLSISIKHNTIVVFRVLFYDYYYW